MNLYINSFYILLSSSMYPGNILLTQAIKDLQHDLGETVA